MASYKVAVAGSTGYSGQELLKLLADHPHFELGTRIGRDTNLENLSEDLFFLCTPNEVSIDLAQKLAPLEKPIIDLSGAFRLESELYPKWYGFEHRASNLLPEAHYGLQQWQEDPNFSKHKIVANPGCYSTAVLMTLLPLLKNSLIDSKNIYIDAKSGVSGAGKKPHPSLMFSEVFGDFRPYKVGQHQHWPEIVKYAREFAGAEISPIFITELLPVFRGISATHFLSWHADVSESDKNSEILCAAFAKEYSKNSGVIVSEEDDLLSLKKVCDSNRIHITVKCVDEKIVICTCIDNLQRGAAGQALMNANQLMGYAPETGLKNSRSEL